MRQIKFRGKRLDNGEWAYGDLIENQGRFFIYHATSETTIVVDNDITIVDIEVTPNSVGQFTGLYDKNGKEIYENDIVLCRNKYPYQVQWSSAGFTIKNEKHGIASLMSFLPAEILVIGNIYDNPELLEDCPTPPKTRKKEIQIGDVIEVGGEKYIAKELGKDQDCSCCDFCVNDDDCMLPYGHCYGKERKDGKDLRFKKTRK